MRITTDLWVAAYLRRVSAAGAFAVVARHGDDRAGAVLIRVDRRDGTVDLYGPAPAGFEESAQDRRWVTVARGQSLDEIDALLAKQISFDTDIWVIDIDDREGRHLLGDDLVRESKA
jgi:hypothetical protein